MLNLLRSFGRNFQRSSVIQKYVSGVHFAFRGGSGRSKAYSPLRTATEAPSPPGTQLPLAKSVSLRT